MIRKVPKRNIIIHKDEFKDIFLLLTSPSLKHEPFVEKFENSFKKYVGVKEAIAVSSGRFALLLILKKLGLQQGDKVLLSAYNYMGVPIALLYEGFCPLFVDADRDTYQIDTEAITKKIEKKTKAIIATHLFGQLADLDKLVAVARKYNLFLIEDAAQALGSYYKGKHSGTIGDIGFFSFAGSKILSTSFGGMIVTNNSALANQIRDELSEYSLPRTTKVIFSRIKTYMYALSTNRTFYSAILYPLNIFLDLFNLDLLELYKKLERTEIPQEKKRLSYVQGFLGLKQMYCLRDLIDKRREIGHKLISIIDHSISIQKNPENCKPNYFMIPIKSKDKRVVYKKLLFKGIDTNRTYASDCSSLTKNSYNPVAKELSRNILTINLPFDLTEKEICYIANVINSIKNLLR